MPGVNTLHLYSHLHSGVRKWVIRDVKTLFFFPEHLLIDMLGEMCRSVAGEPEFWLRYVWGMKTCVNLYPANVENRVSS